MERAKAALAKITAAYPTLLNIPCAILRPQSFHYLKSLTNHFHKNNETTF
jgi:hypothetical protein